MASPLSVASPTPHHAGRPLIPGVKPTLLNGPSDPRSHPASFPALTPEPPAQHLGSLTPEQTSPHSHPAWPPLPMSQGVIEDKARKGLPCLMCVCACVHTCVQCTRVTMCVCGLLLKPEPMAILTTIRQAPHGEEGASTDPQGRPQQGMEALLCYVVSPWYPRWGPYTWRETC